MKREAWLALGPSLLVAAGIVVSTLVAVRAAESRWWVLAAPLLLALSVLGADLLNSRLRGRSSGPSLAALLMAGAILLASLIVSLRDPSLVKLLLPTLGASSWVLFLPRGADRRKPCRVL